MTTTLTAERPTDATTQLRLAAEYGTEAFIAGTMNVPGYDPRLMALLGPREIGKTPTGEASSRALFRAWATAWNSANIETDKVRIVDQSRQSGKSHVTALMHARKMAHDAAELTAAHNGCTLDVLTGQSIWRTHGYGLSIYPELTLVMQKPRPADYLYFIVTRSNHLLRPNHRLGVWVDPKTGLTHIDVSIWIEDLTEATRVAQQQRQLAIWDCAAGKEIYV